MPRPGLLGAIIAKALAVDIDDAPNAQRLDLTFLLSLIEDPLAVAARTTPQDRRRLRARKELDDPQHAAWQLLTPSQRDRARAALAILIR